MNICKYCKKYKIYDNMTRFGLCLKHLKFFIAALVLIIFKERLLLNIIVILIFAILYFSNLQTNKNLIYGALIAVLIIANFEASADLFKKNILWDGDWKIWNWENKNFEHKRGIYTSLCGEFSNVISMIVNFFEEPYRGGRITTSDEFHNTANNHNLWRFQNFHPNYNIIDEIHSYQDFVRYVQSFSRINKIIVSIQNLQTHINNYCPSFAVKSSIAILLNELFISSYIVSELKVFIKNSKVEDDSLRWQFRLRELLEQKMISPDIMNNNIKNLVISLSLLYEYINNDYNFRRNEENIND